MTTELPIHDSEDPPEQRRSSGGSGPDDRGHRGGMYSLDDENRLLEVTYANGDKNVLYFLGWRATHRRCISS
jgi:hypothetical protein